MARTARCDLPDNGEGHRLSLTEYQRKRDFRRTPEPKGKQPKDEATRRYVVHRHHASRLHWDVRLEMRGILASWAVPNGPPLEAGKRRLAVHTEDHPIEYLTFHGVIPDGYGAGSMTIWDTGTYELIEEKHERVQDAHEGKRLEGEWVLVQTKQNEGRDWLMIKHGTPPKNDPLALEDPADALDRGRRALRLAGLHVRAEVGRRAHDRVRRWGEVRLQTRNLLDCTKQYPEATQAAEALPARTTPSSTARSSRSTRAARRASSGCSRACT